MIASFRSQLTGRTGFRYSHGTHLQSHQRNLLLCVKTQIGFIAINLPEPLSRSCLGFIDMQRGCSRCTSPKPHLASNG